jgi:hypothetical protein
MKLRLLPVLFVLSVLFVLRGSAAPVPLFDGKTFAGWEGDTAKTWRIEDGAFVGGSLTETVPRNEFLSTKKEFRNFELRLKFKLVGTSGKPNAGVQFRTARIPNHHEVIGYQADLGEGYWGALYDESRRKKILAAPDAEAVLKVLKKDDWNDYTIRCDGRHIQLWINGLKTVDYSELGETITDKGVIAVQIHGGAAAVASYKDITIEELP